MTKNLHAIQENIRHYEVLIKAELGVTALSILPTAIGLAQENYLVGTVGFLGVMGSVLAYERTVRKLQAARKTAQGNSSEDVE